MPNLLWEKWNRLKDQIEILKPHAGNDQIRMKIRKLKNEASVIKFAIEKAELGYSREAIAFEMEENRKAYKKLWGYE